MKLSTEHAVEELLVLLHRFFVFFILTLTVLAALQIDFNVPLSMEALEPILINASARALPIALLAFFIISQLPQHQGMTFPGPAIRSPITEEVSK